MSVNNPHYLVDQQSAEIQQLVATNQLKGPMFVGQGLSQPVGSDCYGYYIVATKKIGNKTIFGITGANAIMHSDWTAGDMDCSINIDTAKPTQWIIARGKIHRYGKTIDAPQYWYCDANGVRFPGRKASFGWNGAYAYQDPSF